MLINGDCLEVLKDIPDHSVNLVLADAPYQMEVHGRGMSGKRKIYSEMAEYTKEDISWFTDDFLDLMCQKCVYPNVAMFGCKTDIYPFLKYAVERDYNYFVIPLCKKNPMPFCNNTWLSNEYLLHLTDRRIECSKRVQDKIPYFITGNEKETSHPNEKNLKDIERIIINLTNEGDTVLDPFVGSGTTLIACCKLKRIGIGIEKSEKYFELAKSRIEDFEKQLTLF